MLKLLAVLIPALIMVESGGDTNAVGDKGKAVGALQLHSKYVKDANKILGYQAFSTNARYDIESSKRIVKTVLMHYGKTYEKKTGKKCTLEVLARMHNGGPNGYKKHATKRYWKKVESRLRKAGK